MPEYSAALKRLRTQVSWLVKSNNFNEQITRKSVYFESDSYKQVEKSKIKVGKVELIYHFWKLSIFPEFWATVRLDWGAHLKFDFLIEFVAFFDRYPSLFKLSSLHEFSKPLFSQLLNTSTPRVGTPEFGLTIVTTWEKFEKKLETQPPEL